jgi:ADP-heptose:LPS heptosyltransferase
MQIAESLGYSGEVPPLYVNTARDDAKWDEFRGKIVIHTGCRGTFSAERKAWPNKKWIELIEQIGPANTVLVGGPAEILSASEVGRATGASSVCGLLSLEETARVIANASLLIAVDGGPMHIAAAVRTPVIALFGGTSVSKNHPWRMEGLSAIVRTRMVCSPCQFTRKWTTCPLPKCMHSIAAADVLKAVDAIRGQRLASKEKNRSSWIMDGSFAIRKYLYDIGGHIKDKVVTQVRGHIKEIRKRIS